MKSSFEEIRESIEAARKLAPIYRLELGRKREKMVEVALQELMREGLIRGFIPTGNLSHWDIMRGVDFIVVYVGDVRYKMCYLSVTGRRWVAAKKKSTLKIRLSVLI